MCNFLCFMSFLLSCSLQNWYVGRENVDKYVMYAVPVYHVGIHAQLRTHVFRVPGLPM